MAGRSDIEAGSAFIRLYAKTDDLESGIKTAKDNLQDLRRTVATAGNAMGAVPITPSAPFMDRLRAGNAPAAFDPTKRVIGAAERASFSRVSPAVMAASIAASTASKPTDQSAMAATPTAALKTQNASAITATTAAIQKQATATTAAVGSLAAPLTNAISLGNRFQLATQRAGMSLMGMGMKIGIAGATLSALALPLNMLTSRFGDAANKVQDYAKAHGVTLVEAIKKTNSSLTVEQVKLGVALDKSWGQIRKSAAKAWDSVAATIGEAISPILKERAFKFEGIAKGITEAGKAIGDWAKGNQGFVSGIITAAGTAATLGVAVVGLGTVVSVLGANLAVLGGVASLLLNPFVLVTGALIGGTVAWVKYTESGKRAFASLVAVLQPFAGVAKTTMAGVSDAIVAGDLGLAWNITWTGLKLAVAMGFDELTGIVGGRTKEVTSTIVDQLMAGDISGAWNTSVLAMGALWDSFADGVVSTFTSAAKIVVEKWEQAVKSIANMLLEQSAAGGIGGKIATAIIGTDMAAAQAESDRLNTALGLSKQNILDEAKANVAESVGATAAGMKAFLDSMETETTKQADASAAALDDAVGGSADKGKSRIDELKAELEKLRGEAKAKADEVRAKGLPGLPDDVAAGKTNTQTFGTFSAAAALAIGAQGGPAERMSKDIAKQKDIQAKQLAVAEKTREVLEKLDLQWTA